MDAVIKARIAYPDDYRLILHEKKWREAYLLEEQRRKALRIEEDFAYYDHNRTQKMAEQTLLEIEDLEKKSPDSDFHKRIFKIKEVLKKNTDYKER